MKPARKNHVVPVADHISDPLPHITNETIHELARELDELRKELRAATSEDDLDHLKKIERWGRICSTLGFATAWMGPNLISAALISQGKFTRWTMMAHHITHRGYDKVPGAPARYTSKGFAQGWRRYIDWFDWIIPEAWHEEHNILHHYRLGEADDPDLVELNLDWMREAKSLPEPVKIAAVAVMASIWKAMYYAPNTLKELQVARARRAKDDAFEPTGGIADPKTWSPLDPRGRELWLRSLLPYAAFNFGAIPAMYAPMGPLAVASAQINMILAEIITNLHSFAVIVTNHAGDDLYIFDRPIADRDEFYLRQILGSVNFACGDDLTDFMHGWLNYQIEHHLWPDMTMLQYQKAQPRVKALCKKYGVPYKQESVFTRVRKTVEIMVGRTTQQRWTRPNSQEAAAE
jgi:fatty acid desaturase